MDMVNGVDGTDFDSRNHIPSFINNWTSVSLDYSWFSRDGVAFYAEHVLSAQRVVEGNDLHWHTFSAKSLRDVFEIAVYLEKIELTSVEVVETDSELFFVATVNRSQFVPEPVALTKFYINLKSKLDKLGFH
jgi:hypothetical protein